MGNAAVGRKKNALITLVAKENVHFVLDDMAQFSFGLANGSEVQHYMPPQFPLIPILSRARLALCAKSWELIQNAATDKMRQYGKPGIVLFYDEFFYRLLERDRTFAQVFTNVKQRGEVLIKALMFILSMRADNATELEELKNRCRFLGHRHRTFPKVRPHHFAAYTTTCVEVIMYWLGDEASFAVGEAWSNTAGFVLRYVLEPFLYSRTDPYESYQNTSIAAVREITESSAQSGSTRLITSGSSMTIPSERTVDRTGRSDRRTSLDKKEGSLKV
ncbi:hypothetical protein AC1031_003040 [Aphanomyces cochlioides]|nr:hypothetical protein AC1031_003040 [Aphanomyces cochlioides]